MMAAPSEKFDIKSEFAHIENVASIEKPSSLSSSEFDDSIEETNSGRAVWLISACVSMGGFLFGYDTGVISAVLVNLGTDLDGRLLTSKEQELITSLTSGGALVGAVIAGLCADRFGRKLGIYIGCIMFVIGSVLQAAAFSLALMSVGRFVVGLGVGSAAMIIPLYIGELAPAKYRGRLIAFDNMSVTLGQLVSYAMGAGFTEVAHGWRYLVGFGAAPALILAACMHLCPESPRQLVSKDKLAEATKVIARVFPEATDEQIQNKIKLIQNSVEEVTLALGDKSLWWRFKQLFVVPSNRRALISACMIMAISQLCGFNTLMYYSSTLFGLVGFNKPVAVSIVIGGTNFLFTCFNMAIIDKFGRRIICLVTILGMGFSLVVAATAFHWIPISKDLTPVEGAGTNWASILVLVTLIVYVAFYASGVATIGWVGTELLPVEVRALGTMMNTVTCWGSNIIIASTFLSMMKAMTPSGAFGFYSAICFTGWIFVYFCYAEVRGLPLESIRQIYETGWGVREAALLQKELREGRIERVELTTH